MAYFADLCNVGRAYVIVGRAYVIVGRAYVIVGLDPTISVLQYANPKVPFSHIFSLVHICHAFCHHHEDGLQLRQ